MPEETPVNLAKNTSFTEQLRKAASEMRAFQ